MPRRPIAWTLLLLASLSALVVARGAMASEEEEEDRAITFADGKLELTAPEGWKREEPRFRIIEHEFSIPAAEGDEQPGRMTVMASGGSVDANIERWYAQFTQPDGSKTSDAAKRETKKIAGLDVEFVDIAGTYLDRPGPMAPGVQREDYRMFGVIIANEDLGQHFIKFYGPRKTVTEQADAFSKMLEEMKVK